MTSDVYYPSEPPFGPVLNGTQVVVFYHYRPSKPAGFAFLALFAVATLAHLVYLFRLRAWFFIPLVLGGIGMSPETVHLPLPPAQCIRTTSAIADCSNTCVNSRGLWLLRPRLVRRRTKSRRPLDPPKLPPPLRRAPRRRNDLHDAWSPHPRPRRRPPLHHLAALAREDLRAHRRRLSGNTDRWHGPPCVWGRGGHGD